MADITDRVLIEIGTTGNRIELNVLPESAEPLGVVMSIKEARSIIAALREAIMVAAITPEAKG